MNFFLIYAYLFFIGSVIGWVLELLFRNLQSRSSRWINPGFCTGPWLPIYGFGLCGLYTLASLESHALLSNPIWNKLLLFAAMALGMTAIEYAAGLFCLKVFKVRLWDYSDCRGNIQGIICPLFSFFWAALSAVYYFLIHPSILSALDWLSRNLAFSFFIGLFFGVFILDVAHSAQLVVKLRQLAAEYQIVVRYEALKAQIRTAHQKSSAFIRFFRPFRSDRPLSEHLREMQDSLEQRLQNHRNRA